METDKFAALVEVFEGLEDWRSAQQTRHRLGELLTVAVCAVFSGADDFEEVSQWGQVKLEWLRGFLKLDYGVASTDTFERVFALLDPKSFEHAFRRWVDIVIPALGHEQVIAIDGKTNRRTVRISGVRVIDFHKPRGQAQTSGSDTTLFPLPLIGSPVLSPRVLKGKGPDITPAQNTPPPTPAPSVA